MANPILNDRSWNKAAQDPGWGAPDPIDPRHTDHRRPDQPVARRRHDRQRHAQRQRRVDGAAPRRCRRRLADGARQQRRQCRRLPGAWRWSACSSASPASSPCTSSRRWPRCSHRSTPSARASSSGVISKAYENYQNGIVVQAVGATLGVFAVMLVLYRTKIIKVTDRFRRIVITATLGLMVFYLVSFVINLFGGDVPFLHSAQRVRHRLQPVRRRPGGDEPGARLRLHRARCQAGPAEGHGVVRGDRP